MNITEKIIITDTNKITTIHFTSWPPIPKNFPFLVYKKT